jgi:hypothetical protein
MTAAVAFIQEHKDRGEKVYVHCKAAHGRAASIALCWMLHNNIGKSPKVFLVNLRFLVCLLMLSYGFKITGNE